MTEFPTKKSLIDLRDPRVVCHETIVPENQLLLEDTQELSPVGKKNLDAIDCTEKFPNCLPEFPKDDNFVVDTSKKPGCTKLIFYLTKL